MAQWVDSTSDSTNDSYNVVLPNQFLRDDKVGIGTGWSCADFQKVIKNNGGIMAYNYVAIMNFLPDAYSNLQNLQYYKQHQKPLIDERVQGYNYFCGDIFINRFAFRRTFYGYSPNSTFFKSWAKNTHQGDLDSTDEMDWFDTNVNDISDTKTNSFFESIVIDTFYESDYNVEFREEGDTSWNSLTHNFNGEDLTDTPTYNQNVDTRTQLFYPKYYGRYAKSWVNLELNSNSISRLTDAGEWEYYQLFPNLS